MIFECQLLTFIYIVHGNKISLFTMKLKINRSLRRALCAALLTVSPYTLSVATVSLIASQSVSYNLAAQQSLSYEGGTVEAPSNIQWNAGAEIFEDGTGTLTPFASGDNVSFTGVTNAAITEAVTVGALEVGDATSSLSISGASHFTAGSVSIDGGVLGIYTGATIGENSGTGTLILNGTSSFTGDVNFTGDIVIESGTTSFGTGQHNVDALLANSITVKAGATFQVTQSNNDVSGTSINLQSGTLKSADLDGAQGVQFGALSVTGVNNVISHTWNGTFSFESLTSSGDVESSLSLNGGSEPGIVSIKSVTNYNGQVNRGGYTPNMALNLSGVISQAAGYHMTLAGGITNVNGVTFRGEGSVSFNAGMRASGQNVIEAGTVSITGLEFASADARLSLTGGTLDLAGNWDFNSAISNAGTINAASSLVIDLDSASSSLWQRDGNSYILKLVNNLAGGTVSGFDSLTAAENLIYTGETGQGITFNADGSISYTVDNLIYSTVGEATWSTSAIGTEDYTNGDALIIDATNGEIQLSLSGEVESSQVIVDGANTLSLSSDNGAGSLKSTDIELAGSLKLMDAAALHADSIVNFNGGTLMLQDGATLAATSFGSKDNATMKFAINAAEAATITGQLAGSTSMSITGGGRVTLAGALLAGSSSTSIEGSSTLRVNTGSDSNDLKAITGTGTLEFAGSTGNTALSLAGFTGKIALQDTAAGLRLLANQASGDRYELTYAGSTAVSVALFSTGTAGYDVNQHHLTNLSGNINISSGSTAGSYKRDTIVLEMTQDNIWSGTWAAGNTQTGGLRVGSSAGENHKLTITQGITSATANQEDWNALEIRNATVALTEGASWKANILFADENSELRFEGDSQTVSNYGTGSENTAEFISASYSTADGIGHTTNNHGSIVVDTKADDKIITIARTNDGYRGSVSVESGTLSLSVAHAFRNASSVSISGGVLNLNDLAASHSISASGGSLQGMSGYTGDLSITGAVAATGMGGSVSIADTGSLTLDGTWLYSSAMMNEGSLSFADTLTLDLTHATFAEASGVYSLNLMTGGGSLDANSWLTAEGAVDTTKLTGIITNRRDFSYANGVLSYTTLANTLTWTGGDGTWNADASNTPWNDGSGVNSYASGDIVIFEASSSQENSITLDGELAPSQITVNSEQNYSFAGSGSFTDATKLIKDGSGTLTITMDNSYTGGTTLNAGTLRLQSMNALGTGALEINAGTLAFYGGSNVAIDGQNIVLNAADLNIALEDATNVTLSSADSLNSHALNVTGNGTFIHDKWAKVSSVYVGEGATVHFNETNANVATYKTISGGGKILVGHTDPNRSFCTQFNAANLFSGTLELVENGDAIMDIDHSSADYRSALILGDSSELVITADAAATLYLDGLSGGGLIRFDWNNASLQSRNINLEMTGDQNFSGSFYYGGGARMGNFIIGSNQAEHYTFTFSGAGMITNDTSSTMLNLVVGNATVEMTNNAVWNGGIQLTTSSSVLHFSGNATTRAAGAGAISGDGSVQVSADTTLNGANTYTNGTSLSSATLTVGHVSALGFGSVTVNSGTLNLAGLAVTNDVTAASGSLAGFSAYAGALSVTGNVSVADNITGNISIADTGNLTLSGVWDFSEAMVNEGTLSFTDSLILDLTDYSFDAGNNFTLFTGAGSANIDSWLTANSADLSSHLLGVDTTGKSFSYSNGVLSYSITSGDIHIPMDSEQSISSGTTGTVIFDTTGGADLGVARLADGFVQNGLIFEGEGVIGIADNQTATLSEASTAFTGATQVGASATLNIAGDSALGESDLSAGAGATINLAAGVSLTNETALGQSAVLNAGVLTVTATGASGGNLGDMQASEGVKVTHIDGSSASVSNANISDVKLTLADNGSASITNSTLTATRVELGDNSELTLQGVTIGLGSSINNNIATLKMNGDNIIQVQTGSGLENRRLVGDLDTLEGGTQEMLVYSLTSLNVANIEITDALTLDIVLTGDDLAFFESHYGGLDNMVAFELLGVSESEFKTGYGNVTLNIYKDALGGTSLFAGKALGYTLVNGNIALYIPEPSTATLSLLALAGLLARRRRKTKA